MSALLDSLASGFDGDAARREALDAALRDGLPLVRSEAWKYTPLRALDRRSFVPATAAAFDSALLEGIPAPRMVFVNGRFDAAHSDLSGLPPTWIGVGDQDLFHDEDLAHARRLRAAGVPCTLHVEPGMYHGADANAEDAPSMRAFRGRMVEVCAAFLGREQAH